MPEFEGWPKVVKALEESTKQHFKPQTWGGWGSWLFLIMIIVHWSWWCEQWGSKAKKDGEWIDLKIITLQNYVRKMWWNKQNCEIVTKKCNIFLTLKYFKCRHFLCSSLYWDLPEGGPADNYTWRSSPRGDDEYFLFWWLQW